MSGYHSVSVVAEAYLKGTLTTGADKALDACVTTARQRNYEGIGLYIDKGLYTTGIKKWRISFYNF